MFVCFSYCESEREALRLKGKKEKRSRRKLQLSNLSVMKHTRLDKGVPNNENGRTRKNKGGTLEKQLDLSKKNRTTKKTKIVCSVQFGHVQSVNNPIGPTEDVPPHIAPFSEVTST